MKKILTSIALMLSLSISYAHTLQNGCWTNNRFGINITQGDGNGKIEITTYTSSNRTTVLEATRTFILNSNGAVSGVTVSQPNKNTTVFVYVRWFSRNSNGTYSPVSWNSGQGYANSYSSIQTSTNQCTVVALTNTLNVSVKDNNAYFTWTKADSAILEISDDKRTFTKLFDVSHHDKTIVSLDGVKYFRLNLSGKYSNIVRVDFKGQQIDFSKPYKLLIFDTSGKLIKRIDNRTQYEFFDKGSFILLYVQETKDSVIRQRINYFH